MKSQERSLVSLLPDLARATYLTPRWCYNAIPNCRGLSECESSTVASTKACWRGKFGFFACLFFWWAVFWEELVWHRFRKSRLWATTTYYTGIVGVQSLRTQGHIRLAIGRDVINESIQLFIRDLDYLWETISRTMRTFLDRDINSLGFHKPVIRLPQ